MQDNELVLLSEKEGVAVSVAVARKHLIHGTVCKAHRSADVMPAITPMLDKLPADYQEICEGVWLDPASAKTLLDRWAEKMLGEESE